MCPLCSGKTRVKVRRDTILENFPLFCPKCKEKTLVSVREMDVLIIERYGIIARSH